MDETEPMQVADALPCDRLGDFRVVPWRKYGQSKANGDGRPQRHVAALHDSMSYACSLTGGRNKLFEMSEGGGTGLQEHETKDVDSVRLVDRGRLLLFLGVFVLELLLFFGATVVPIAPAAQQQVQQAARDLQNSTAHQAPVAILGFIFANNAKVALAELIPGVGPVVFFISMVNTGQVIQVIGTSTGVPAALLGSLLFVFPFTIVELSAYALAVCSGSMLIIAWRRKTLHREARVFAYEVAGVVVILLLAATMETITLLSYEVGLALWLPTGLLVAWLAITLRRTLG